MFKEFTKGLWRESPTFALLLGLCPTLATSTAVTSALGMAAAATFVLVGSNLIISLFGRFFPAKIRIPCYIVVIATFVATVELLLRAYQPALYETLGIFIPLIVVNCIILGRAEAFAGKNRALPSVLDGLGMGMGFGLAIFIIASIREFLGSGKLFGITVTGYFSTNPGAVMEPIGAFVLAPGAFVVLGLLLAGRQALRERANRAPPEESAAATPEPCAAPAGAGGSADAGGSAGEG